MKLVFLGTGGSYPSPRRNVVSLALKYNGDVILFDCGEGTQRQLMRSSLSFMDINKIFITHLHGDHFLGLPGLIQSMKLNERENPLEVYGPAGTKELLGLLMTLGYFNPNFKIKGQDIEPGTSLKFKGFTVKTVPANHNVPALAYVFKEDDRPGRFNKPKALELGVPEGPLFGRIQRGQTVEVDGRKISPDDILGPPRRGRKVVYTGDTRPSVDILDAATKADVLVHEGTFDGSMSEIALEKGHSSVTQAAEIARKADVDRLFIVHISPRYEGIKEMESEAKEIFPNTTIPRDLSEYEIRLPPDEKD